jgi:hypothetical protein
MGLLRKGGFVGQIVGAVLVAVGTVMNIVAPGSGAYPTYIGIALMTASSVAVAVDLPPQTGRDGTRGRHRPYFSGQFNPIGADVEIQVPYGQPRVFPGIPQSFLTPLDKDSEPLKAEGAALVKGQKLSLQLVVGEGPIESIEDIEINRQTIWEDIEGEKLGTGTGSKKKFEFPRKNLVRDSLVVYVAGTQRTKVTGQTRNLIYIAKGNGSKKEFLHYEGNESAVIDLDSVVIKYAVNQAIPSTQSYKIVGLSDRKFKVKFTKPVPAGQFIQATYTYTTDTEGATLKQDGKKTFVIFGTAPASGAALTYDGKQEHFPDVTVVKKLGEVNQAPAEGQNQVRNSRNVGEQLLEAQPITHTTVGDVDDVSIALGALQGMILHHHGADSGKTSARNAIVTIDYRDSGAAQWTTLPNPAGGTEFKLKGETDAPKHWEISIRETLRQAQVKGKASADQVDAFDRGTYEVRVTRVDAVKASASGRQRDRVWWTHATEIQDETLSYPGTAYFWLHAVASERLQGALPVISCLVKGRKVKNLDTGVTEWTRNPAWCAADLLTNSRYGAGVAEADLITQDWIDLADWCDETVTLEDATTETRCELDIVVDDARAPLAWIVEMLATCRAVPVLKGKKWGVFIDKARTTDKTYEYSGATANEELKTLSTVMESRSKTPTEIEVQYRDRDKEFESQTVLIVPETRTDERVKKTVVLNGVTRRTQAIREGTHALRSVQNQPILCEFRALPDGALSEAGDVILVKSETGGWTAGKLFRVLKVGFDAKLRVRLVCREYDANLYSASTSELPTSAAGPPVNATPSVQVPAGSSSPAAGKVLGARANLILEELTGASV